MILGKYNWCQVLVLRLLSPTKPRVFQLSRIQVILFIGRRVISVGKKTRDSRTLCRNLKKNKPCPIKYCQRCVLNRYGEKAEEVAQLEDWKCPKCRGICNCSFCRKKIGCAPTGILVHKAKATGFSSVSEMLQVMDPDNSVKNVKEMVAYPKKACYPEQGVCEQEDGDILQEKSSGTGSSQKVSSDSIEIGENGEGDSTICQNMGGLDNAGAKRYKVVKSHTVKNTLKFQDRAFDVDVQFPQDTRLTTVTGIELPPEDVGDALQFLEFCAAFGKDLITYRTRHGLHP
ncbi:uncharacterized protein LOC117906229 [Vitis riparia]|uniref:uncharacterized protein LOC117906229 n=1 Tax=Vitis riparia TaxID=96939 RepID=UPI00155A68AC|nr:uncharacterized protein LOC117906229 [Vitis riparia]